MLKLSLGRGEVPNLTFRRYEWPCVMVEYTHAYDPVPSVKIDFIGNFGGPEACVLTPPASQASLGALNLYVSIALSIIDYFFPGAEVYLQDAATTDVVDRTRADQFATYDTFPMSLSALKQFAGRDTTAYGGFGFFSADRPEGRLAVLRRYYKTMRVDQAVQDYVDDYKVRNFFFFYDQGIGLNTNDPETIGADVEARVQALGARLGLPFSLHRPFAEVSDALVRLVTPGSPSFSQDEGTRIAARRLFNLLQDMFLGNFVIRYQKRVPGAWETFKTARGIGTLIPPTTPPEARVEYALTENEGQGAAPYDVTVLTQTNVRTLTAEKRALARTPAYAEGPTAAAAWLPRTARAAPPVAPRTLRSRATPYARP